MGEGSAGTRCDPEAALVRQIRFAVVQSSRDVCLDGIVSPR